MLEAPIAELLRVAHACGVPLAIFSGSPATAESPPRLLVHKHNCETMTTPPELAEYLETLIEVFRGAMVSAGAGVDLHAHAHARD